MDTSSFKKILKEYKPWLILAGVALVIVILIAVIGIGTSNRDDPADGVDQLPEEYVEELDTPDYASVSDQENKLVSEYDNKVVSFTCANGKDVSFGVDMDEGNYLYLNPVYSDAAPDRKVIFYFWSDRNDLEYDVMEGVFTDQEEINVAPNLAAIGRTHDLGIPSDFVDETNFGVRWKNNVFLDGKDKEAATTHIFTHVIRVSDAQLLASLKLTVAYDAETGKYGITSIEDNDVLNTKRMFPEDRSSLVNTSVECLSNDDLYPIISGLSEERLAQIKASAVVEQIPQPFNSTFYDTFGEVVSRTDFPTDWSYYAVNLYVMPHGVVTFYFISPTIVDRPVDELDLTAASFGEDIDDSLLEDIEQEDGTEPAEDVTTDEESTPLIEYNLIGYEAYDCQTQDRFAVTNPLMLNS